MFKVIRQLIKLRTCYFCSKIGWHKERMRIVESPKDYITTGILVPVCKKCYSNYSEEGYK